MNKTVLSIQSHVVHGYVGNNCALFPLQAMKSTLSTQSNSPITQIKLIPYMPVTVASVSHDHSAYKHFKGQVLGSEELDDLLTGLRSNRLLKYSYILTGYVASSSFLKRVCNLVKEVRDQNPSVKFVCDPVMGDNGAMYVPEELLPIYRDSLIPLADIITPNQYEAEELTTNKINSIEDAKKVMKIFHDKGVKHVVLTSLTLPDYDDLVMLASEKGGEMVGLLIPKKSAIFTGTGDLFTAVYLAWSEHGVKTACEKTLSTMQAVLKRTLDSAIKMADGGELSAEHLELRLIQSKEDIENPPSLQSVGITAINF